MWNVNRVYDGKVGPSPRTLETRRALEILGIQNIWDPGSPMGSLQPVSLK